MSTENAVETTAPTVARPELKKPVNAPVNAPVKAPVNTSVKRVATKVAANRVAAPAVSAAQPLVKVNKTPKQPGPKAPVKKVKKALAKAVPVAPWPPASVTTGGPVAAVGEPAVPAARRPGTSVGVQTRAKKLSIKPSAPLATPAKKPAAKPTAKPSGKAAGKSLKAGAKRAKPGVTVGDDKQPKARVKLVRDSFTMPQVDFDLIDALKKRALGFQHPAKKSELLRAGLQALAALDDARLGSLLKGLPLLKPGRPKKAG